jgi:cytochrome P450
MVAMSNDPFALASHDTLQDPYPAYARLRAEAPVHFSDAWGGFVVARHADTMSTFRDPRLSANRSSGYAARMPPEVREKLAPLIRHLASWTLLMDPPEHTRLRGLVQRAFTPQRSEALRPRIESIAATLLEPLSNGAPFDVVTDFAMPLPIVVIGELLGVPRDDAPRLKAWSDALAAFLGGTRDPMGAAVQAVGAVTQLEEYFREQISIKRRERSDDLLGALIAADESGKLLDEQELLSTCASLLFGGHETTTNLITNGVHLLLEQPAALEATRSGRATWLQTVDEILRFDSPVQRMGRVTVEPVEIAGVPIDRGQRVWLALGSANRDESVFERAGEFDATRPTAAKHMSFGFGPHYCVGAALGRIEAEIALKTLFERAPRLARRGPVPERLANFTIRGFEHYPVATGSRDP